MARKSRKKTTAVRFFQYHGLSFPIPVGVISKTEVLTRKKRQHADSFDEAVLKLEAEVKNLVGEEDLTPESWNAAKSPAKQASVKAAMAILMTFGVISYPVPEDQEKSARALAKLDA